MYRISGFYDKKWWYKTFLKSNFESNGPFQKSQIILVTLKQTVHLRDAIEDIAFKPGFV
jgi:hypothetical protein